MIHYIRYIIHVTQNFNSISSNFCVKITCWIFSSIYCTSQTRHHETNSYAYRKQLSLTVQVHTSWPDNQFCITYANLYQFSKPYASCLGGKCSCREGFSVKNSSSCVQSMFFYFSQFNYCWDILIFTFTLTMLFTHYE